MQRIPRVAMDLFCKHPFTAASNEKVEWKSRFESIDDADKCINEIRRRYKNLHPTFSKVRRFNIYFRFLIVNGPF
jgi:hypothetical protein